MRKQLFNNILRRLLLIEAMCYLSLAKVALICLPYKRLTWFLNRPAKQPELRGEEREMLRKAVRWSILRAAKLLPWKTVCFPQGIAAQAILRRRRISTTLYYGAATQPDKGLTSHVWVQDGSEGVIGHRAANGYKIIAKYPE